MLTRIVLFEWRYATRRLTFLAAAVLFALMGFLLAATGFGPDDVFINGPYSVALSSGLLSLVSVFALTILCAPSLLRDVEHQMEEIVYATAVTKTQYLLGRFAGSFLAAGAAFVCAPIGLWAGGLLGGHDPSRLGPFDALHYLWPLLVLTLPNMLFVAALLFAVAALTRSTMATYVAGAFVYVLYFVAALFTNSPLMASAGPTTPEGMALAALADPFGLSAFFEQTHYWTAAERNVRRLALRGHLLQNRLFWTTVTVLLLALAHWVFDFKLRAGARGAREDPEGLVAGLAPLRTVRVRAPDGKIGWAAWWSAVKLEVRFLLRSWPFAALMVLWLGGAAVELVQTFRSAEFGTALVPTTGLMVGENASSLVLFGLLMLVYYAADSAWRERSVRLAEVVDATPASSALFQTAKLTALSLLVGLLVLAAIVVDVLFQILSGHWREIDPVLYASLFYFVGLPLVLFAVLALLVQTLSANRHIGLLITLIAGLVWHRGALGGPDHPLLRYAAAPEVPYSALGGLHPAAGSFHWFMGYWAAFAVLLCLVTFGLWPRGSETALPARLRALPRRWGPRVRLGALCGGVLFVAIGAAVFYQTNALNAYETEDQLRKWKADYERTYHHLGAIPQPSLVHVSAEVSLYPEERRFRVRGRYTLENRTAQSIPTVWVVVRRDVARVDLSLAGRAPAATDTRFGTRSFFLEPPLAPGARTELSFDVTVRRRGAQGDGADHDLLGNGSFMLSTAAFPSVGYRRSYELGGEAERRRHGLPPRALETSLENTSAAGLSAGSGEKITFDVIVSTTSEQTVIAPGVLLSTWMQDGRRHARFAARRPVRPYLAFASARYATERIRHAGVDVEVYYHPGHGRNVPHIRAAAVRSLDYFIKHFGPYPHPALRIAEVPSYAFGAAGLALPGVVYLVEHRGFLTDRRDQSRVDIVSKRIAHEVSHQWWGHELCPATGPGALVLVETLARYSELMVLKEIQGRKAWTPVLEVELDRYLSGRTGEAEVPLDRVGEQGYLGYAKGALVMMAMHDLIGEEAINGVLRGLLAEVSAGRTPAAVDLVEGLRRATPEAQRGLVDQWWKEVVLYDLRVETASVEPLPDGRFRLAARLGARKTGVRDGQERALALDESLDVAVYSQYPDAAGGEAHLLHSAPHHFRGTTELEIVVARRPAYVAIDPFIHRIDRNRADNIRRVDEARP